MLCNVPLDKHNDKEKIKMGAVKAVEQVILDNEETYELDLIAADSARAAAAYLKSGDRLIQAQEPWLQGGRVILAGATDYDGHEIAALVIDHERNAPPVSRDLTVSRSIKLPHGVRLDEVAQDMGGWSRLRGEGTWR